MSLISKKRILVVTNSSSTTTTLESENEDSNIGLDIDRITTQKSVIVDKNVISYLGTTLTTGPVQPILTVNKKM